VLGWRTGAYGELAHMANQLWQAGVWKNDIVSFFSCCILLQKTAYFSASRQDLKNLVGKFEAIHVRITHANFQASSCTGVVGK